VVVVPRCGHAMMAERPDAVLAALKTFLAPLREAKTSGGAVVA